MKKTLPAVLLLALGAGYVLGGLSVRQEWFPYRQLNTLWQSRSTRLADVPNADYPEVREQYALFTPHAGLVFLGDSLTQVGEWHSLFPGLDIANRGIGGDKTDDILARLDAVLALHPARVFLQVGYNDLAAGRSVSQTFDNLIAITERLRQQGSRVFLQSTLECTRSVTGRCGGRLDQIRELNARLADHAARNGMVFIDLNARLADKATGLLPQYTYDGVHLRGSGYAVWGEMIAPFVNGAQ